MTVIRKHEVFTKFGVVPFIEENFPADFLTDDVPWVDGARAAHQRGQDGVRGEDVDFRIGLGQFPDNRIVGGGHGVEDPVDAS